MEPVHICNASCSHSAKIKDHLFLGSLDSCKDIVFLNENNISGIISLGTGIQFDKNDCLHCDIDILDMDNANILKYFDTCHQFIDQCWEEKRSVLVHCVYGQSRSATIVISYLMYKFQYTLSDAYEYVYSKRSCIHLNKGFQAQLDTYEKMLQDINKNGHSHSRFRMLCLGDRRKSGRHVEDGQTTINQDFHSNTKFYCKNCNYLLFTSNNRVLHYKYQQRFNDFQFQSKKMKDYGICSSIFVEPTQWYKDPSTWIPIWKNSNGKLYCPRKSCKQKIGSWHWDGIRCACGYVEEPGFSISEKKIDRRASPT